MDTEKEQLFTLSGTLKKVLYHNEENSYIIAVLENNQKICGHYFDTDISHLEGEEIELQGSWETHQKYGVQFNFVSLNVKEDELHFFFTKIVKGFTKKTLELILKKYSVEEIYDILDNTPAKLLEFKGIKEKKLTQIVTSWNKFKHLRELAEFLGEYGVTKNLINKIFSELGHIDGLINKLKNNPYILTNIKGIGFKRADEIAVKLGIDNKSPFRIKACIEYTLKEYCDSNGNSSIDKDTLFSILNTNLNFINEDNLYENSLITMLHDESIHQTQENRFAPSMLYHAEKRILEFFKKRKKDIFKEIIVDDFTSYIKEKEKFLGFSLSSEQEKAVQLINHGEKTICLVGYAGTGKSTSSKAILNLLEEKMTYQDIMCIALSGVAAQRISDTTGYQASTIQSLLVSHKEKDYFPFKVILLDEASMVNSVTFYQIISKIEDDTTFIIVGDDGQLPAIGAGNILSDCIKYNLCPITTLTKIYRQNEKQAIAVIANDIRQGHVPEYEKEFDDFKFLDISIQNHYVLKNTLSGSEFNQLRNENSFNILNKILEISSEQNFKIQEYIKDKKIDKALTCYQIITPMKGGVLGVENINNNIQKLLNPRTSVSYQAKTYNFRLSDKVIHTKNENMKSISMENYKKNSENYSEKRIFNGMLGMIIKIDYDSEVCIVLYPNDDTVVFYDFNVIDNLLSLAYCLTIHKTQGMEYDTALIPMSFSHFIMHNTKLLYTAITRAKEMCYIVGEKEAFESACKKLEITQRQSVINDLLLNNI
jgi:exodeoxyribonuclease V alpha subunit